MKVKSPFREDNDPSFVIYTKRNGDFFFIDFATDARGDVFSFVQTMYNCSFVEAIKIMLNDFGLEESDTPIINPSFKTVISDRVIEREKIGVNFRKVQDYDRAYWAKFSITNDTLRQFKIKPVSHVYTKRSSFKADKHAYAFMEKMNNDIYIKVYQPYSDRVKWISSMPAKVIFGWRNLPATGDILILTKALKEVMSIYETLGIPAVAIQSESVMMKKEVLDDLKSRFKVIISLFDNDNQGQLIASKYEELGIPKIFMKNHKNYTDMIEVEPLADAKEELLVLIKSKK